MSNAVCKDQARLGWMTHQGLAAMALTMLKQRGHSVPGIRRSTSHVSGASGCGPAQPPPALVWWRKRYSQRPGVLGGRVASLSARLQRTHRKGFVCVSFGVSPPRGRSLPSLPPPCASRSQLFIFLAVILPERAAATTRRRLFAPAQQAHQLSLDWKRRRREIRERCVLGGEAEPARGGGREGHSGLTAGMLRASACTSANAEISVGINRSMHRVKLRRARRVVFSGAVERGEWQKIYGKQATGRTDLRRGVVP